MPAHCQLVGHETSQLRSLAEWLQWWPMLVNDEWQEINQFYFTWLDVQMG